MKKHGTMMTVEDEEAVVCHPRELTELDNRLKTIVHSTRTIATCASLKEVGDQILEEFAKNMEAQGGSLYFLEGGKLVLKHVLDPGHAPVSIPLPLEENSVFGKVLAQKAPVLMKDIKDDNSCMQSDWKGYKSGSLLALPLFDPRGDISGIVTLHNKRYPPFTDHDREIGAVLASYGGEAIKAAWAIESLRESEQKYRLLVENMNDAVYIVDENLNISYVSPVMEKITGYASSQILGENYRMLFPAEERSRLDEARGKLTEREPVVTEYSLQRKSGECFWIRTSSRPIFKDGRYKGFQGVLMDITTPKQAAMDVAKRADELTALNRLGKDIGIDLSVKSTIKTALRHIVRDLESDFSCVFLKDGDILRLSGFCPEPDLFSDGNISIHKAGDCLCGIALQENQAVFSMDIHTDPRCMFKECKAAGARSVAALPMAKGDDLLGVLCIASRKQKDYNDQRVFLEAFAAQVAIGLKNAMLYEKAQADSLELERRLELIEQGQQEKKELSRQLQQSQKMEAIGSLAGGIAHDFNNILAGIIGYTELALIEEPGINDKLKGYLHRVLAAGNRAKDLIQQILKFSRRSDEYMGPVSISPVIKESVKLLQSTLPSFIEVQQRFDLDRDRIIGDPTQIHQIVMNLCTNAYHAMRKEGGILTITLQNEMVHEQREYMSLQLAPGDYLKLSIADTGCGMSKTVLDRMFEPYFTTKKMTEGTGLGLAVVLGIVKNHNGFLEVYSKPGKGTRFNVFFPLTKNRQVQQIELAHSLPTGNKEKILIVDDEVFFLDVLKEYLDRLGYEVTAENSSRDMLETFKKMPTAFDLVITDQTMPEMTGVKLASEIRKINSVVPIILCTGYSETILDQTITSCGITKFIMKPVNQHDIAWAVHEVLKS